MPLTERSDWLHPGAVGCRWVPCRQGTCAVSAPVTRPLSTRPVRPTVTSNPLLENPTKSNQIKPNCISKVNLRQPLNSSAPLIYTNSPLYRTNTTQSTDCHDLSTVSRRARYWFLFEFFSPRLKPLFCKYIHCNETWNINCKHVYNIISLKPATIIKLSNQINK